MLQIVKVERPAGLARPYRLVETFFTSEGPRNRVCSGAYPTFEAATVRYAELEAALVDEKARLAVEAA